MPSFAFHPLLFTHHFLDDFNPLPIARLDVLAFGFFLIKFIVLQLVAIIEIAMMTEATKILTMMTIAVTIPTHKFTHAPCQQQERRKPEQHLEDESTEHDQAKAVSAT